MSWRKSKRVLLHRAEPPGASLARSECLPERTNNAEHSPLDHPRVAELIRFIDAHSFNVSGRGNQARRNCGVPPHRFDGKCRRTSESISHCVETEKSCGSDVLRSSSRMTDYVVDLYCDISYERARSES